LLDGDAVSPPIPLTSPLTVCIYDINIQIQN
jgi:hypothetical protein